MRHHANDAPSAARAVTIPGIETTPATARPASSRRCGMPNSTKRCGSRVASTPNAKSGITHHPRTASAPARIVIEPASAASSVPRTTIPTTSIPTTNSP
ncbi:Uncharacterised protein [Mycobacteroides abscessus]|nr:Uncharacterised protein [Mycobacteroides abscessus]